MSQSQSQSRQDSTTESGTGTSEYETTEYDTTTRDDDASVMEESVASSQPASSTSSFFDANKAPESDYQKKIREAKEQEARKKRLEARRKTNPQQFGEDNKAPLAPEHYTVEVKRRGWDDELKKFREKQRKLLKNIRVTSKRKVAALHERIFFTIRWANPSLPSIFKRIILEYCDHLLGPFPERKYEKTNVMHAWFTKYGHTAEAKVVLEVKELCERLRILVLKRDEKTVKSIVKFEEKTELLTIQKEGDLRWHMETMHCARDDYWTIWYLSRRNHLLELTRMLETCKDVDVRDPDFGYTPLHYACKENHFEIFSLLLKHGASEKSVIEEDGRQPLHLAAQFGTKEMCLELLAIGADFWAKDKYGSTPLDLAVQSKNYPVITVLQNWTQLLPPEEEKEEVVEDLSAVPEEFMSTPYEVLLTMSPALRVLTTRLEGNDVNATHSFGSGMDVGVEIRLCERRCNMCLDEGFFFEALKSKKRRWTVAKNGYLKQLEDEAQLTDTGENINCDDEVNVTTSENIDTCNDDKNKENSSNSSETHTKPTRSSTTKLTASLLYSICSDLFETLISEKIYDDAEKIMIDGLAVILLDDATRISLLKRHCELLLFLSDKMTVAEKQQPSVALAPAGMHSRTIPRVTVPLDQSYAPEEFNHTTSYASLNVSDDDSKNYNDMDHLHHNKTSPSFLDLPQSSLQHGSVMINPSASAPIRLENNIDNEKDNFDGAVNSMVQENNNNQTSQEFLNSSANYNSHSHSHINLQNLSPYDLILMRAEGDINECLDLLKSNYDFNFIEPLSLSPLLELAAEIADRQGRFIDALHFMEHSATVKERTLGQAHCDTVRVFIEALRLLLRKQMMLAAARKDKRDILTREEEDILNESVSSRLMNEKKINKIREARNKLALAEDKKYFSEVGQQATDVSRRLDRLSAENEEEALKLSRKCYNLVSLTELIVQGEVEPNKVLPQTGELVSLRSLNSKSFPAQFIHALERSAFDEEALKLKT